MQEDKVLVITSKQLKYVAIFLIAIAYIFPVILLNEYYKDDVEYFTNGLIHGYDHARPVKEWLFYLLGGSTIITDTRPIPLILTGLLAGYIAILLQQRYIENYPFMGSIAGLFIVFNPFYIEVLFFNLDSLNITLAIFLNILIFSKYIYFLNLYKKIAVSLFLIIVSLSGYQGVVTFYLTLLIANMMFEVIGKKEPKVILQNFGIAFFCLIAGQLFVLLVITPIFELGKYAEGHSSLDFNPLNLWLTIKFNIQQFNRIFVPMLMLPSTVLLLPICVYVYLKFIKYTQQYLSMYQTSSRILFILLALFSPILLYVCMLGPLLLIEATVLRARVLIGFGVILFIIIGIFVISVQKKYLYYLIIPIFYSFILINVSSNTQKDHIRHQDQIITFMYKDIIDNVNLNQVDMVYTYGTLSNDSLATLNSTKAYPLIWRFLSNKTGGNWTTAGLYQSLTAKGLRLPYVPKNHAVSETMKDKNFCKTNTSLTSNGHYNIYIIKNILILDLSKCVVPYEERYTTPQGIYW